MPRRTYTSLPTDYAVCIHADCPLAATCLHQLAKPTLIDSQTYLRLINPNQCLKDNQCKFVRDSQPVAYARAFINMKNCGYY